MPAGHSTVEETFRREFGRAVATLVRLFGDIDLAEEAVQEAFTVAVQQWPATGVPPNPGGWIVATARNRAIDRLRRESSRDDRHAQADVRSIRAPAALPEHPEVLDLHRPARRQPVQHRELLRRLARVDLRPQPVGAHAEPARRSGTPTPAADPLGARSPRVTVRPSATSPANDSEAADSREQRGDESDHGE